jgi:hypothetical protein
MRRGLHCCGACGSNRSDRCADIRRCRARCVDRTIVACDNKSFGNTSRAAERKFPCARSTTMARTTRAPSDGMATALGIHLCLYCAVAGCLAYGLYALLQPAHFANPGVATYQPPPSTVVTYTLPLSLRNREPGGAAALTPAPETMGLSAGRPEAEAFAQSRSPSELEAMPSKRPSKPRRDIQPVSASPQRRACIPSYDSSGAQTGAC